MLSQTLTRACENSNKPVLRLGDKGPDVQVMRQLLAASQRGFGFAGLAVGDDFFSTIETIVKEFQEQVFLLVDGSGGPQTWKALCADGPVDMPLLRRGDNAGLADTVRLAQERLSYANVYSGAIDGDFGPITQAAVVQFQQDYNLSPDGIIGPLTWKALSFIRKPLAS